MRTYGLGFAIASRLATEDAIVTIAGRTPRNSKWRGRRSLSVAARVGPRQRRASERLIAQVRETSIDRLVMETENRLSRIDILIK